MSISRNLHQKTSEYTVIMQDKILIQKRINFLQNSLIQLSRYNESNLERSILYKSLLGSLNRAKMLLEENIRIENKIHIQDS